jgi:hypothetical protein
VKCPYLILDYDSMCKFSTCVNLFYIEMGV